MSMLLRSLAVLGLLAPIPAIAQTLTPDNTVNTQVTSTGGQFTITGGEQQLNNLFHSFERFSPGAADVLFQLDSSQSAVELVIGRVTGATPSLIDGQLQLLGGNSPDLLLLNPNGITFGPNAELLLPGSFLASTGESILFDRGLSFSATQPGNAPLTISGPIGLQLGNAPASIQINGSTGHQITGGFPTPTSGTVGDSRLQLAPGNSLILLGGAIQSNRGVLQAPSGRVELGAIAPGNPNSNVELLSDSQGWTVNYDNIEQFAPIDLVDKSLVDISGFAPPLGLSLTGNDVHLTSGTVLLANNFGSQAAGDININAAGDLVLKQLAASDRSEPRILSYSIAAGAGSNINLSGRNIQLEDGSSVFTNTLGPGRGGHLTVRADESVNLIGTPDGGADGFFNSTLAADTFGPGPGGDITIIAPDLNLRSGGLIVSLTAGSGQSGDIVINAENDILVTGRGPEIELESGISASSFGPGNAGELTLNTQNFFLQDGAIIEGSNLSQGASGSIFINASDSIEIQGSHVSSIDGIERFSTVRASAQRPTSFIQNLFNLGPIPSGKSGTVQLNSPIIQLDHGGQILALNEGVGDGGEITVTGDQLSLNHEAQILTVTESGNGGSITLSLNDLVASGSESLINAESFQDGDGGNIKIESPLIFAFDNSDITAAAVTGNGGNVEILAQTILGLKVSNQLTPGNDITASSELGLDGMVSIQAFHLDQVHNVIELPKMVINAAQQIATDCQQQDGNSFIITGNGGLPIAPIDSIQSLPLWQDVPRQASPDALARASSPTAQTYEASTWRSNALGQVELVQSQD